MYSAQPVVQVKKRARPSGWRRVKKRFRALWRWVIARTMRRIAEFCGIRQGIANQTAAPGDVRRFPPNH